MVDVLGQIIELMVGGITEIATGIGTGLNALVTSIFIDATGETMALTAFGGVVAVFAGIALAVGLSRLIVSWIGSLGGSNV